MSWRQLPADARAEAQRLQCEGVFFVNNDFVRLCVGFVAKEIGVVQAHWRRSGFET